MYGGSPHNRARFLLEVIRDIKKCPNLPLAIRLSGIRLRPDGITIEETCEVAEMCEAAGADAINITWVHAEVINAARPALQARRQPRRGSEDDQGRC